ncbi:2Fe-2S iron-sulfur cluster-binding protein [Vibrio chagasii]|nr:2Fe-2S iron-sulfur cluster-binding protein [Vibrio chagasii]
MNSVFTFVSALHGKQPIARRSANRDKSLHPVQKAVVDFHGSQCGYCMPGFIMSMFALGKINPMRVKKTSWNHWLVTYVVVIGYRPIVDAANVTFNRPTFDFT